MTARFFQRWMVDAKSFWWDHQSSDLKLPIRNHQLSPFFIVSAGRSGTTLLRKKLANSAYIHIPPESDDFIPSNAIRFIKRNKEGWDILVNDILEDFRRQPFSEYWSTDLRALTGSLHRLALQDRSYANLIDCLYTTVCKQYKPDLQVWGDKTPYLMYRLEWLRRIFPSAKYIHVVRDGRAVVHSMVRQQGYSLRKAAIRWRDSIRLFEDHKRHVDTTNILEVKYEHFVVDPANWLAKVSSFLGVDHGAELLNDRQVFLGDDVRPHHAAINKPITADFIDAWKDKIKGGELVALTELLSRELKIHQYRL